MPNFWRSTIRKFYDIFSGHKTNDSDFNLKIEQLRNTEKSVDKVKAIYSKFDQNFSGFKNICREIYQVLPSIYDKSSPYWSFIDDIIHLYMEAEQIYDNLILQVQEIEKIGIDWDSQIKEVLNNVNLREVARRNYDHYEDKMQKISKKRQEKIAKNEVDLSEDNYFLTNEQKYKESIDEYVRLSYTTFQKANYLINFQHNYINPTLVKFTSQLRKFFAFQAELFAKVENLGTQLSTYDFLKSEISYDPTKFMRATCVIFDKLKYEKHPENLDNQIGIERMLINEKIELKNDLDLPQNIEMIKPKPEGVMTLEVETHVLSSDVIKVQNSQRIKPIEPENERQLPLGNKDETEIIKSDILDSFSQNNLREDLPIALKKIPTHTSNENIGSEVNNINKLNSQIVSEPHLPSSPKFFINPLLINQPPYEFEKRKRSESFSNKRYIH